VSIRSKNSRTGRRWMVGVSMTAVTVLAIWQGIHLVGALDPVPLGDVVAWGFFLVVFLFTGVKLGLRWANHEHFPHISLVLSRHSPELLWATVLTACFASISLVAVGLIHFRRLDLDTSGPSLGAQVLDNPGALFTVFTGLFTVWALLAALSSIGELSYRFTTFDHLLTRSAKLLREELERFGAGIAQGAERPVVRFICTTPLNGNVSERETLHYDAYTEALDFAVENLRFRVLHISPDALGDFYNRFRTLENGSTVDQALAEGLAYVPQIRQQARNEVRMLPEPVGYRLLLTTSRAIFYAPMFLPPRHNDQPSEAKPGQRVEMIGFETRDDAILSRLGDDFEALWRSAAAYPAPFESEHGESGGVDQPRNRT